MCCLSLGEEYAGWVAGSFLQREGADGDIWLSREREYEGMVVLCFGSRCGVLDDFILFLLLCSAVMEEFAIEWWSTGTVGGCSGAASSWGGVGGCSRL